MPYPFSALPFKDAGSVSRTAFTASLKSQGQEILSSCHFQYSPKEKRFLEFKTGGSLASAGRPSLGSGLPDTSTVLGLTPKRGPHHCHIRTVGSYMGMHTHPTHTHAATKNNVSYEPIPMGTQILGTVTQKSGRASQAATGVSALLLS